MRNERIRDTISDRTCKKHPPVDIIKGPRFRETINRLLLATILRDGSRSGGSGPAPGSYFSIPSRCDCRLGGRTKLDDAAFPMLVPDSSASCGSPNLQHVATAFQRRGGPASWPIFMHHGLLEPNAWMRDERKPKDPHGRHVPVSSTLAYTTNAPSRKSQGPCPRKYGRSV